MIDAVTARAMASVENAKEDILLRRIFDEITTAASRGEFSCNVHTGGEHLRDGQEQIIRDNGFVINWSRPCLWYEISW